MSNDSSKEGWEGFLNVCLETHSHQALSELFNLFFTIEEKETLSSRFLIIRALLEGKLTQREISEIYRVSIAQITRGSNALKIARDELKTILKKRMKPS